MQLPTIDPPNKVLKWLFTHIDLVDSRKHDYSSNDATCTNAGIIFSKLR